MHDSVSKSPPKLLTIVKLQFAISAAIILFAVWRIVMPPSAISNVLALPADKTLGRQLAQNCSSCHNASNTDAGVIAGSSKRALVAQLINYRSGKDPHPEMDKSIVDFTDEEIAALAAFVAEADE